MSPEAQRIAIAEACGHTNIIRRETCNDHGLSFDLTSDESYDDNDAIPDYLNDLNAMHDAEMTLTNKQRRAYASSLVEVHPLHYDPCEAREDARMHLFLIANMTAAQRAEAFLRTIGNWDDSNVT